MGEIVIKHHIELINKSKETELFEKYKDQIWEMLNEISNGFDFSLNLKVYVFDYESKKGFVNGEEECGFSTITKYGQMIGIYSSMLKLVEYDGGLNLYSSLFHEFAHVFDHHHVLKNPYCKINPMKLSKKTMEDFVFSCGYNFWTEFFAYYKNFYYIEEEREHYPTILMITKAYKNLNERCEDILNHASQNSINFQKKVGDFMNDVDEFVYALSKHLAGSILKNKAYSYCEKTKNSKEFRQVSIISKRLLGKIAPLFKNTYGRGMVNKIGWLGKCVIDNVYVKFNIYPKQGKKQTEFVMYKERMK